MKKELVKQVTLAMTLLASINLIPLSSLAEETTPSSSSLISSTSSTEPSEVETGTTTSSSLTLDSQYETLPSSSSAELTQEQATSSAELTQEQATSSAIETAETEANFELSVDDHITALGKEGVDTSDIRDNSFLAEHPGGGSLFFSIDYQSKYGLPPTIKVSREVADKAVRLYAENYLLVEETSRDLPTANIALAIKSN